MQGKRHPGVVPAAAVAVVVLFVGYAFIRLGAEQRETQRHAAAAQIAATSAYSMERHLEGTFTDLSALAAEISQRGSVRDFRALATATSERAINAEDLFFVSGGRVIGLDPVRADMAGPEDLPVGGWTLDAKTPRTPLVRGPTLVGPVQMATGEWVVLVRMPLFLADQNGVEKFVGWLAASVPLDKLLHSSRLDKLSSSGYEYQLSYLDPNSGRQRSFSRSGESYLEAPVTQVIRLTRGEWTLSIAPRDGWSPWSLVLLQSLMVCTVALLVAVPTYDLTRRSERLRREINKRGQRLKTVNRRLTEEIQQREELEKQFSHTSFHDALTGLPNRRYFMDRLERALLRARGQPGTLLAVIVLNFDRFKNVNDSLGYTVGDELLMQAAHRFENCVRPADLVIARVSGDEFAMLLFDLKGPDAAAATAQRLLDALAEPFNIESRSVFITASMGIALSSSGYEPADELVRGAGIALSKAKAEGRARYAAFDPATREHLVTLQQLETDLHLAIERGEFRLNFQPIVALETGRIAGMETLVRWQHPFEGMVPPDRFIRLAEETGLIVSINRWVLREACLQARAWRRQFPADVDFYLSVNLSGQDLSEPDLCDFVAGVLRETELPVGMLRLEVTEGIMIGNVKAASDLVSRLREMGVPLLLDDFGTGYSSLSYLHRFKFDFLKIDRAFVNRITPAGENAGIVRAIVHLAKDLGIRTIAEGVETAEQKEQLRLLGCDYAQGYYFSKPVEYRAAEKLLLPRRKMVKARGAVP